MQLLKNVWFYTALGLAFTLSEIGGVGERQIVITSQHSIYMGAGSSNEDHQHAPFMRCELRGRLTNYPYSGYLCSQLGDVHTVSHTATDGTQIEPTRIFVNEKALKSIRIEGNVFIKPKSERYSIQTYDEP